MALSKRLLQLGVLLGNDVVDGLSIQVDKWHCEVGWHVLFKVECIVDFNGVKVGKLVSVHLLLGLLSYWAGCGPGGVPLAHA